MLELKVMQNDKSVTLKFEHSLLSLSKWESKHKVPFLSNKTKTTIELVEYFEEMLVYPVGGKELIYQLTPSQLEELTHYINASLTASSVPEVPSANKFNAETVTSELIYYWMVGLKIPFDAEKWHLSRLMMLIRITNFKSEPPKKQNAAHKMAEWKRMNEERKAKFNTKG